MTEQVYWPSQLHDMWERILPCVDCRVDPELRDVIPWHQYAPLKTIGILPPGRRQATYLLLAAEPSGAARMKDRAAAIERQRAPNGVRNFSGSRGDIALQYAVERWLIDSKGGESYYVTDLAKCCVATGKLAQRTAERRYATCARWLEQELALLRPRAIVAVGKSAFRGARLQKHITWPAVFEVSHYGAMGVKYWKDYLFEGWESEIPETAVLERLARARWPLSLHSKSVEEKLGTFPESYRWLLAMYRVQFGEILEAIQSAQFAATGAGTVRLPSGMRVLTSPGP